MLDRDAVVIVGGGLAGAACAWALTRRGHRVTLLEQFAPAHRNGSSHGSARIVRRAYGDALYTRLTGQAFALWDELASPTPMLRMIGALDFGPGRDVRTVAAHLAAAGVSHELLPSSEAESRWPGMRFEGDVLFHAQAGTLDADAAVSAFLASAAAGGADVRYETPVTAIGVRGDTVVVSSADGAQVEAATVVVAAGGWVESLLDGLDGLNGLSGPGGLGGPGAVALPPLTVTAQPVWHFPRRDVGADPWPSVIHESSGELPTVYHLAGGRDGGPDEHRKLGHHHAGPTVRAGEAVPIGPATRAQVLDYVRAWLPGLVPEPSSETTCLYTRTPSQDFVLDRVGPVVVCSPCSGHGAKFAPLVGEFVADLIEGRPGVPDRFSLAAHAGGLGGAVSL